MSDSTPSHRFFERREILRELASNVAEQCGFLMGNDKALTKAQRQALLRFASRAWAAMDAFERQEG